MKKPFLSILVLFVVIFSATAQDPNLLVKGSNKNLYVEHKVAPKESFYAVGRRYNAHPKFIAAFNKIDITKGLVIGQVLRIPLTDTNFTQTGNSGTPVYYKLGENEGLMKVSSIHNDVALENLRSWNGLIGDSPKPGSKLIVGFLISSQLPSVTVTPPRELKTEGEKIGSQPTVKNTEPKNDGDVREAVVKETVVKPVVPVEVGSMQQIKSTDNSGQGYFKYSFEQQLKNKPISKAETVTSGIFKTTSGWEDEKYYLLMDAVQPGTIVRIINPGNNKSIYAKVLGGMSGIRQNDGLSIRISNAGASALQVTEQDKFVVKVSY